MSSRPVKDALTRHVLPPLAASLIRLLRWTVRLRVHGREPVEAMADAGERYVHVFWHAHLLLMVYSYVGPRLVFMISRHRDGELIARTVQRFGYVPARGSTTRGGTAAWREMIRAQRQGSDIGFTPDGPRGPARRVQPGCVLAARHAGLPIVPIALGATRRRVLDTWDGFIVPKPGARVLLAYGAPMRVEKDEPVEDASRRLEHALVELERFAERHAGDTTIGTPVPPWRRR